MPGVLSIRLLELARDRERDVLFVRAAAAGRAGIVAAVAGVDRDDDIARLDSVDFDALTTCVPLFRFLIQIEHEAVIARTCRCRAAAGSFSDCTPSARSNTMRASSLPCLPARMAFSKTPSPPVAPKPRQNVLACMSSTMRSGLASSNSL